MYELDCQQFLHHIFVLNCRIKGTAEVDQYQIKEKIERMREVWLSLQIECLIKQQ